MPRDITVQFDDGTSHVYKGAPDDISPSQVEERAMKDFSGKRVTSLEGGRTPKISPEVKAPTEKEISPIGHAEIAAMQGLHYASPIAAGMHLAKKRFEYGTEQLEKGERFLGEKAQEAATRFGLRPEVAGVVGAAAQVAPEAALTLGTGGSSLLRRAPAGIVELAKHAPAEASRLMELASSPFKSIRDKTINFIDKAKGKKSEEALEQARKHIAQMGEEQAKRQETLAGKIEESLSRLKEKKITSEAQVEAASKAGSSEHIELLGKEMYPKHSMQEVGSAMRSEAEKHLKRIEGERTLTKTSMQKEVEKETSRISPVQGSERFNSAMSVLDNIQQDYRTSKEISGLLNNFKREVTGKDIIKGVETQVSPPPKFNVVSDYIKGLRKDALRFPSTGAGAAINRVADEFEQALRSHSPAYRELIDKYPEINRPVEELATKTGKALTATTGGFKGELEHVKHAEDLPKMVFGSPTNYEQFVQSIGGNVKFAEEQASKYFGSEIRGMNSRQAQDFIEKHSDVLNKMPSVKSQLQNYVGKISSVETDAVNAARAAKNKDEIIKSLVQKRTMSAKEANKFVESVRGDVSEIMRTEKPESFSKAKTLVDKLARSHTISEDQARIAIQQISDAEKMGVETTKARETLRRAITAMLYGAMGSSAGYWTFKTITH